MNFLMLIDISIKTYYIQLILKYVLELEKEYLYICNWIALLCTWNKHNIVSWLYFNIKKTKKKTKKPQMAIKKKKKGTPYS